MLKEDALKKICPFKLAGPNPGENGNVLCHTTDCMAWEEWTEPISRDKATHEIIGHRPKEPAQGHCGMIPPELNCSYG